MQTKILTLTGPSCSGKTTLARKLTETGFFNEIVSFTSREPRNGEIDGVDYYFKTVDECKDLIDKGLTAEHVEFKDKFYGIETKEIEAKCSGGKLPVVIVEPHGLQQLRTKYDCFSVYVDSDLTTLYRRFLARFRLSPDADLDYEVKRLAAIREEWLGWGEDYYSFHIEAYNEKTEAEILDVFVDAVKQSQGQFNVES